MKIRKQLEEAGIEFEEWPELGVSPDEVSDLDDEKVKAAHMQAHRDNDKELHDAAVEEIEKRDSIEMEHDSPLEEGEGEEDEEEEMQEEKKFECTECGETVTAEEAPDECPECGGEMEEVAEEEMQEAFGDVDKEKFLGGVAEQFGLEMPDVSDAFGDAELNFDEREFAAWIADLHGELTADDIVDCFKVESE